MRRAESLRAQEIFEQALLRRPDERRTYVTQTCGNAAELLKTVLNLLEADSSAGAFLDAPFARSSPGWTKAPEAATTSSQFLRTIGPYRVSSAIGQGGSSRVFLAERSIGDVRQRVAIKLLRRDPDSFDRGKRFRREAGFLAALEHRNVARLLDSGTSDQGFPYLVMEYVEGEPITDYCNNRRLSLEKRLAVFREVCATVQFAHHNLIVHRDLKPANILITDDGHPKLLDFGIAKLLEPAPDGMETATDFRVATPSYASPEHMAGGSITTASDVYSLGVILCELLSGRRPYETAGRSPLEILSIAQSETRPRMSSRLSEPNNVPWLAEVAKQRRTNPARLRKKLRGDLDKIVAKALAAKVEDRYAAVRDLEEDLQRHEDGLPIRSETRSLAKLALGFARRRPLLTVVASFLLFSLFAVGAGSVWHVARVGQEQEKATQAQLRAERVVEFLVGVFDPQDPVRGRGQDLTVLEAIKNGAATLDTKLTDEPLVRSEIRTAIGRIYRKLGAFDEARRELSAAIHTREALGLESSLSDSLLNLGELGLSEGNLPAAEEALTRALAIRKRLDGPESRRLAEVLFTLGQLRLTQTDFSQAEQLFQETLRILREDLAEPDALVASTLGELAQVYRGTGRYELAVELVLEAIAIEAHHRGPSDLAVGQLLNTLGHIYNFQGQFANAEDTLLRALSIFEAVRPPDHLDQSSAMHNLTVTYGNIGDYVSAESYARRSLSIKRKHYGKKHPQIAGTLLNIANLEDLQGRYREALELYRETVAMASELLGPNHDLVADAVYGLGTIYQKLGQFDQASERYQSSLRIYLTNHDADDDRVASCYGGLGEVARLTGDFATAREQLSRAEKSYREASESHPQLAWVVRNLALVDLSQGRKTEAAARFEEALELRRFGLEPLHPDVLESEVDWAELLIAQNRPDDARTHLQQVIDRSAGLERAERPNSEALARVATAHLALATVPDPDTDTSMHLEKAAELLASSGPEVSAARSDLARVKWLAGEISESRRISEELDRTGWYDPRLESLRKNHAVPHGF